MIINVLHIGEENQVYTEQRQDRNFRRIVKRPLRPPPPPELFEKQAVAPTMLCQIKVCKKLHLGILGRANIVCDIIRIPDTIDHIITESIY